MAEITLYNDDCLNVLRAMPDETVDLVFFDPPYGLAIAEWDTSTDAAHLAAPLAMEKLKPGGSLYATCSPHILPEMMRLFPYRRIIAWCKPNLPLRKNLNEWEWSTEYVLWVTKGEPASFNKPHGEDARDYWRLAVENGFLRPDRYNHPARKPYALVQRILDASSQPGDSVLDPFMGSASMGVACARTGRNYTGIEIDRDIFQMAFERIQEAQQQLPLL